jgi:membrane associated rhomboid family serine protease
MVFPIGDVNVQRGYFPYVSYTLIAINILVFLYELSLGEAGQGQFFTTYGNIPAEITKGIDLHTLFSSLFLHGGWMHLIGNMLFLWVFADNIEATVGHLKFLLFYLLGGIAASYGQAVIDTASMVPSVGASGSISACLGAYMLMFPRSQIKVLVLIFFRSFNMAALYFLGLWIVQQVISGYGALATTAQQGGVAYWAHIAGFVFGIVAGLWFKKQVHYQPQAHF